MERPSIFVPKLTFSLKTIKDSVLIEKLVVTRTFTS
jgi:hypothetical protein